MKTEPKQISISHGVRKILHFVDTFYALLFFFKFLLTTYKLARWVHDMNTIICGDPPQQSRVSESKHFLRRAGVYTAQ